MKLFVDQFGKFLHKCSLNSNFEIPFSNLNQSIFNFGNKRILVSNSSHHCASDNLEVNEDAEFSVSDKNTNEDILGNDFNKLFDHNTECNPNSVSQKSNLEKTEVTDSKNNNSLYTELLKINFDISKIPSEMIGQTNEGEINELINFDIDKSYRFKPKQKNVRPKQNVEN